MKIKTTKAGITLYREPLDKRISHDSTVTHHMRRLLNERDGRGWTRFYPDREGLGKCRQGVRNIKKGIWYWHERYTDEDAAKTFNGLGEVFYTSDVSSKVEIAPRKDKDENLYFPEGNEEETKTTHTTSISDAERFIESELSQLKFTQYSGKFLSPIGYKVVVELCSENGRSKRRNAPSGTWSPEEDEVRIYFERIDEDEDNQVFGEDDSQESVIPVDLDTKIKDICSALSDAEKCGHAFIAFKFFRDSFLPHKKFRWNKNTGDAQFVLTESIARGLIVTGKVSNPKNPDFPTTTIKLRSNIVEEL